MPYLQCDHSTSIETYGGLFWRKNTHHVIISGTRKLTTIKWQPDFIGNKKDLFNFKIHLLYSFIIFKQRYMGKTQTLPLSF